MSIRDAIRIRYDLKVRPKLDPDLRRLNAARGTEFLFTAEDTSTHLRMAFDWMWRAHSAVERQGLPNKFVVGTPFGLGVSYPETTGYTVNTFIAGYDEALAVGFDETHLRALIANCMHYLMQQQLDGGAFTGGHARLSNYQKPSVFNTGQIVLGLAEVYEMWTSDTDRWSFLGNDPSALRTALERAGTFLAGEITPAGHFDPRHCFKGKVRTYYSRAAYGLMRTGIVLERPEMIDKSRKFFDWTVDQQQPDGWIDHWGFEEEWAVLHTIAYTLRGLVEAGNALGGDTYHAAVRSALDHLYAVDRAAFPWPDLIPSHISRDGRCVKDLCLTGLSQLAIVLKKLPEPFRRAEDARLFDHILHATQCSHLRGFREPLMNGVMPASYPINGRYQGNDLIEWGTKFFMDTLLIARGVQAKRING